MSQYPESQRDRHAHAVPKEQSVIRIVGLVDGTRSVFDGQFIVEYDPSRAGTDPVTGRPMPKCHLVTTPDVQRASRFDTAEVVALYRAVDRRQPTRPDGQPNRPLTAFTVEIDPAEEAGQATELPPAGWYVDPGNPYSLRWWDGTNWTGHLRAR